MDIGARQDSMAGMSFPGYRSLITWQKAQDFADAVIQEVARLPRNRTVDAIAPQLLRSAGSIPANIAEGYGRFYEAAYRNHLSIARGSLFETETWLDLLVRAKCLPDDVNSGLLARSDEAGKLLTAQMKKLQDSGSRRAREEGPYDTEFALTDGGSNVI